MASSSSTDSTLQCKFDVFLSFRGEDTRTNFTDHLYTALDHKGIITFRDNERLEKGNEIRSELLKAIEGSKFSIIVLSKNYASSTFCLDELAKIVECLNKKVFPVFYKVDPSEVRKQTGDFKKAFDKHEEVFKENKHKVQRWRTAITQVADLSGWHVQDSHEAKLIKDIVEHIWKRLNPMFPSIDEDLVGMDSRMEILNTYLETELDDVRFIGICGMGGIGKTTIARVVYHRLSYQYDGSSFLSNIREVSGTSGLVPLQEQLLCEVLMERNLDIWDDLKGISLIKRQLCSKRVLLVLDDVDQLEQLKKLAGKRDWFGPGSRVIITTRDENVLINHGVKNIYKVGELNHHEALQLFHLKAFKHDQPTSDHAELSNHVVQYTKGLPLALEVLGSLLCNRSVKEWRSALDRLQEFPEEVILKVLRISYDGLKEIEKKIFLDIACFFNGKDKDRVIEKLDRCGFHPNIGIRVLIDKSLITISENKLRMHDLLQEMGREIVREQHHNEPGEWSRLWLFNDVNHVLTKNTGTKAVEGIVLDKPKHQITHLKGKSFSSMKNLRLLKISKVHLSEDLDFLSNELRFLKWHGYPSKSLPSSFEPEKLYKLNLCYSRIEYLWKGMKDFKELKTIKLSYSLNLTRTPDFKGVPNLEKLELAGCTNLVEVHQSVGLLKRLTTLNLKDCKKLVSFPNNVCGLKSLRTFNLYGCSKIDKLPQNLEKIECLEELDVSETAIRQVPPSIVVLKNLKILSFHGCKFGQPPTTMDSFFLSLFLPKRNPDSMCLSLLSGCFLEKLDLSDCNLLEGELPNDLGSLSSLKELKLSGNNFFSLPASINQLCKLCALRVDKCQRLRSLPELPPKIAFVMAADCPSLETLSGALKLNNSEKIELNFFNCFKLVENEDVIDSLIVMLLKDWLQRLSNRSDEFHILLPGCISPWKSHILLLGRIIPWKFDSWASYRPSVHSELPPNWLNDHTFMGVIVFVVFELPDYFDGGYISCELRLKCSRRTYRFEFQSCRTTESNGSWRTSESHRSWFFYVSRKPFEEDPEEPRRIRNATYIRASFHIYGCRGSEYRSFEQNRYEQVVNCGIRLVYKQDMEHWNPIDVE